MDRLDPERVAAWRERWNQVAERERLELGTISPEMRFRQLVSLFEARNEFIDPERDQDVEAVRARWLLIRRALGV